VDKQTTQSKPSFQQALGEEMEIGVENVRRIFRLQMLVESERQGESLDVAIDRLESDPATAQVAAALNCTVDELMENFGVEQPMIVHAGYSPQDSSRLMEEIIQDVMSMAFGVAEGEMGRDAVDRAGRRSVTLAAPRVGESRSALRGDVQLTRGLREKLTSARTFRAKKSA